MENSMRKAAPKKSFPLWGWILVAIVVVAAIGIAVMQIKSPAATSLPAMVTVPQAAQLRDDGAFILDVRDDYEWVRAHIPGSTHIPLMYLPDRLNEIPADRIIVVVCIRGNMAMEGRDILLDAGFTQVYSLGAGVVGWQWQGMPIATGECGLSKDDPCEQIP